MPRRLTRRRAPFRARLRHLVVAPLLVGALGAPAALAPTAAPAAGGPGLGLELGHVYVWVARGAPEGAALERAGITLAPARTRHDGGRTAHRVSLSETAYL